MANPAWQLTGDFCESCSCFYICSCSTSNFLLPPNKDYCFGALVFHVDRGSFGETSLDDLSVALLVHTPEGPMITAKWSAGLIVDERANPTQQDALTRIFSGQAGGAMAGRAAPNTQLPLVGAR